MARYIDADRFKAHLENAMGKMHLIGGVHGVGVEAVIMALDIQPTADAAEVKHGEWRSELQKRCDWRGKKQQYYVPNACSECHEAVVMRTPFCPNCGAKMDGGDK